jgi:hypothetical protein
MTIFTREDVEGQHQGGIEDHQAQSRQRPRRGRPQFRQAMLGRGQVIAVEDLDAITGEQFGPPAVQLVDEGCEFGGRVADQGGGDVRL